MDRIYCRYKFVKGYRKGSTCDRWVKKRGALYCYQHKNGKRKLKAIPEENEEVVVPAPLKRSKASHNIKVVDNSNSGSSSSESGEENEKNDK